MKHSSCSDSCFILAFIYIDRLLQKNAEFALSRRNVHRVILTAMLLAIKFYDDIYYSNAFYSQIGGIQVAELNRLEAEMLLLTQFDLCVDTAVYAQYYAQIKQLFVMDMSIAVKRSVENNTSKGNTVQTRVESMDTAPSNNEIA